jgi:hypothetical protein
MTKTWAGRSEFSYIGSVSTGTKIFYGKNFHAFISNSQYADLRRHFLGNIINVGTSRTNPPTESLGWWLQQHVSKTALASYVAPILLLERYAIQMGDHEIKIIK